jgi:flagellar protein FlgJ
MSYSSLVSSNSLAADSRSLDTLKLKAGQEKSPAAIKEAAKQFESLFMRELLKSMRQATMKSGLNNSSGEKLGTDMLDQQFAVKMSGQPGGLSDLIEKQLSRQTEGADPADSTTKPATPTTATHPIDHLLHRAAAAIGAIGGASTTTGTTAAKSTGAPAGDFVQLHEDAAEQVATESGIPASFMLGQAGHETGWGRHEIHSRGGVPSHNLFGIKAGGEWKGRTVDVTTTEYTNGQPHKIVARFRAYDSYADSFRDYAKLINDNPRYAKAREKTANAQAYALELKRAGYATDPAYATKLSRAIASAAQWQQQTS